MSAHHEGPVRQVPLTAIQESALNPRRLFDPTQLEELAASLKRHGVLQPLVVRMVKGRYELIAGARRLRAAAIAKLAKVPIVVRDASDDEVRELMLVENLQREGLDVLDECEGFWTLVEKSGYTATRIAESIGKSVGYVSSRMKLRDLAPEARAALVGGRITVSHAIELARVPMTQQRQVLKIRTENRGPAQMSLTALKSALRPTVQRSRDAGNGNYVVQQRCWRCNGKLEFDTDGNGNTLTGCPSCLKFIRNLEDQVRRLTAQLKEKFAA